MTPRVGVCTFLFVIKIRVVIIRAWVALKILAYVSEVIMPLFTFRELVVTMTLF